MRSVIKITLGIEFVISLIISIFCILMSIMVALHAIDVIRNFTKHLLDYNKETILINALIILIFGLIKIVSSFIIRLMINKMDTANRKYKLIPFILLLFITFTWIPMLMIIFTPSKFLLNKNPYFM